MEILNGVIGPSVRLGREGLSRKNRSVGKILGTGKLLGIMLFQLRRFLYGESPEVFYDELYMFDRSAGLGEVLGNFDIAEATDIVRSRRNGRIDGLCRLSESGESEEVHDGLFRRKVIAGNAQSEF
jgi:hypothetical protein